MNENCVYLLTAILECKSADLSLLDHIDYDMSDIVDGLREVGFDITLGSILQYAYDLAVEELNQFKNDRIAGIEAISNSRDLGENEEVELFVLNQLDAEKDLKMYFNFSDTHVCFERNGIVWDIYLHDEIDIVQSKLGFEISGRWRE